MANHQHSQPADSSSADNPAPDLPAGGLPAAGLIAALRAAGCVFAEDEAAILQESARSADELDRLLAQRVQGMPLEHIVGWAEFDGVRMAVAPGVFVPRRRSVFLVEQVVAVLAQGQGSDGAPPVIVDLCCGSGALGAAVARRLTHGPRPSGCELHAADVDPAAAACAAENVAAFHGRTYCGNLFDPLPKRLRGTVDAIVANAPYVPAGALEFMPREARLHEPEAALNGGTDGLDLHRAIAAQAKDWLRPGGVVLLECGTGQAAASAALLAEQGLASSIVHSEAHDCTVVAGVSCAALLIGGGNG